jgi:hypothetical protein
MKNEDWLRPGEPGFFPSSPLLFQTLPFFTVDETLAIDFHYAYMRSKQTEPAAS